MEVVEVGWLVAKVVCRSCGQVSISVYPDDIEYENAQECPFCHYMACYPITYYGPEEKEYLVNVEKAPVVFRSYEDVAD